MCDENVDYKKMYLTMVNAMEDAINTLVEAQKKCEELYISAEENEDELPKTVDNP